MSSPGIERPDLPEAMTWEELEHLPEEIAQQIELWNGRVVQLSHALPEYQALTSALASALQRCADEQLQSAWRVDFETKVFFGEDGKSDFASPNLLACRPENGLHADIRAANVSLIGEILPPDPLLDRHARQARYAVAGIPFYWEVTPKRRSIALVRAYALESAPGQLPPGARPLHTANYLLIGEWSPKDSDAITIDFPFPIHIPWSELEF
ncbi:Uma2 family endonuclease [Nocardia amamiensis]|uniref:Uma2 family endonuclease n=1 Tax=Nocardia amamiensis TaxID=404578 RepID=A0ABS0CSD9_9NOCA|nr:Uma2 family endonuclease [Nocardia amamiensis]MBF6297673.1 Uma2 family endonuclease [Nocardia amamiensis]